MRKMHMPQNTEEAVFHAVKLCHQTADDASAQYDAVFFSLPYWDIYTPFSALPCLVGALKNKGWKAKSVDIGIMFFHVLFEKNKRVARAFIQSKFFYREYVQPYKKSGIASYEEYLEAAKFLDDEALTLAALRENYVSFTDVQRGILGAFYNMLWMRNRPKRFNRSLLRLPELVAKNDFAPFLDVITRFALFPLLANLPPVVGISITSLDQLAASCLWARFIKLLKPDATLVAGGSCLTILKNCNPAAWEQFFDFFDYLCMGEGESCITGLVDHVHTGAIPLADIPNLVYKDGESILCTREMVEDANTLPPPCYDEIDFSLYLTPEPMLSYQTSRGCFWGKCAFCDFDKKWRSNFRQKSLTKVVHDLRALHERYGVNNFTFVDEAVEPKFFEQLVGGLEQEEFSQKINWLAYLKVSRRYTPELCARAKKVGCRMVMLGVETFNQRLLNFICKGISAEDSVRALKNLHENGIKTHAWLLTVLPSQTKTELLEDVSAIKKHIAYMDRVSLGYFRLLPSTDMFNNPERFNILHIEDKNDLLDGDGYNFTSSAIGDGVIDRSELLTIVKEQIRPFIIAELFKLTRYERFFDASYFREPRNKK